MGASLKTHGIKAVTAVLAGATALMARGAVELENLQARIMSETGATVDEADAIADSVNRISGKYRMALDVVGDIAIRVKRDLGLVGAEADAATDRISAFARVTGRGAEAVSELDDILDAYELSASDLADVQDRLLTQWQRTGGDMGEMLSGLAAMAPQLKAFNLGWEDGIAILGLANDSGIATQDMLRGLNTAIGKVEPGTTFDDILARLSAIPDDGERAREAIELFGARAGPKLANAIKPGVDSLDAWAISQDEATGAVLRSNDALDSTPVGRIKKFFSEISAAARGVADEFGSLLSAAASFALVGSSLGLGGPAKAALKAFGGKIMGLIGAGMVASAGSGIIVDAAGDAAAAGVKSSGFKAKIGGALASVWKAIPGSAAVTGALTAAGSAMGGILAAAIPLGIAAAAAAIGAGIALVFKAVVLDPGLQQQTRDIGTKIGAQMATGTIEQLETAKAALAKGIADIKALPLGDILYGDQIRDLEAQHAAVVAELERRGSELPGAIATGVMHDRGSVEAAIQESVVDPTVDGVEQAADAGAAAAEQIPAAIGDGVLSRQSRVRDAFDRLKMLMDNVMTKMEEVAYLKGVRTSKKLEKALSDGRPAVRAQAQAVLEDWEARMTGLIKSGGKGGAKAQDELERALKSKVPEVRAAAERVKNAVGGEFEKLPPKAAREGTQAGNALNNALRKAIVNGRTITIAAGVQVSLGQVSGARAGGGPVRKGFRYLWNENTDNSEVLVAPTSGYVLTHAEAVAAMGDGGGGGDTIHLSVPVTGYLKARTPGEVSDRLQQLAAGGVISNPRRRRRVEVPSR